MKTKLHFVLSLSLFLSVFSVIAQQSYWQKIDRTEINSSANTTDLNLKFYQTYWLDIEAFKAELTNAPMRSITTTSSNYKV
jgi:Tfp pilus assembly protein PilE